MANVSKLSVGGTTYDIKDAGAPRTTSLAAVATSGSYNDLSNKPTIPDAQIQSDWNQTTTTAKDYIKNKPTIPAAQVQSDWNATSGMGKILNKPSLATVATSGSYNDLSNKPTIPAAQVQTDWNATSGMGVLLNKPSSLPASDVYPWAKAASKPSYTASDVGALSSSTAYLSDASVSSNTLTITKSSGATVTFQGGGSSTDTKNTAGATNSTSKLFLVGATSQGDNPQTYSNSSVYATNGALTASSFNATSAKKFKEDINAFDSSALDIVNKTDIVSFVFKDDADKTKRIGFIADDADALISTPSHCYMDMYNCIGVLFKAVQELSAEVERLKNNG